MNDIGDRMKRYEAVTQYRLAPRTPVILRLDGRAFHTLTRNLAKPFDEQFMDCMVKAAQRTCCDIQGFQLAYVQSDEVNILLTDYEDHDTQGWFDYKLSKILSIAASTMSVWFSMFVEDYIPGAMGVFDARAFNIPEDDVSNYFVWRIMDWERNSLNMYAQSVFSHRELQGMHANMVHGMLHDKGLNWATDLNDRCKNGTWLSKIQMDYAVHRNQCMHSNKIRTYQEVEALWRNKSEGQTC